MAGLEGRCKLLIGLGDALEARPDVIQGGRPGDMLGELPADVADFRLPGTPSEYDRSYSNSPSVRSLGNTVRHFAPHLAFSYRSGLGSH